MFITEEDLKAHQACDEQLALFVELFPNGVEVTEEVCLKYAQDFDWDWAACEFLSLTERDEYLAMTDDLYHLRSHDDLADEASEKWRIACAKEFARVASGREVASVDSNWDGPLPSRGRE